MVYFISRFKLNISIFFFGSSVLRFFGSSVCVSVSASVSAEMNNLIRLEVETRKYRGETLFLYIALKARQT